VPGADTATALWWAVVASGVYHGLNPGMGWPLAVSAALMNPGRGSLYRALAALAVGHCAAMLLALLPFAALLTLAQWRAEIRTAAALLVIALGAYLLINRRHPRFLSRVPPSRLALWSFLVAMAHGAGLMLVPLYLGICGTDGVDADLSESGALIGGSAGVAVAVAAVHGGSMTIAGGTLAFAVHRWLGLRFLSASWFNLDVAWALSLILVGILSLALG
jgi:hypothetical protein